MIGVLDTGFNRMHEAMFGKNFANLNMDGAVNGGDLGRLLGQWG